LEGKYRMVRRILANCGHPVVSLHRERIGTITIQDLPVGQCRPLTPTETIWAHGLAPKQKKK
jgi:16S rRNA U516 pseudouridylate synthase RsuA-like enzyme